MTIHEAIKTYPTIETDLLLENILGQSKEFLYTNPSKKLTDLQTKKLIASIKRRQKSEPIAYILGYKYFYGLKFKVNKHTLIPRPETEWLVDKVLEIIKIPQLATRNSQLNTSYKPQVTSYKILDLGTGSGCIAITIAKQWSKIPFDHWIQNGQREYLTMTPQITASDISPEALKIARSNANTHKTKIKFIKSNLFQNIKDKYDLIIANLPYVPINDYKKLKENLKYEPKPAITDGTNQNIIYTKFFEKVQNHLKPNSIILMEIDPTQKDSLPPELKTHLPKSKITFHKDLNKLYRYAIIKNTA